MFYPHRKDEMAEESINVLVNTLEGKKNCAPLPEHVCLEFTVLCWAPTDLGSVTGLVFV